MAGAPCVAVTVSRLPDTVTRQRRDRGHDPVISVFDHCVTRSVAQGGVVPQVLTASERVCGPAVM